MKRFKDLLLSVFIIGSIFVIILIIVSFFNVKRSIEITTNEANETRLNNLKYRVRMISDGECKDFLNDYISKVDNGNFKGDVKLKDINDYIINDYAAIMAYNEAKEKCNISNEEIEKYGINGKFLTILSLTDSLFNKYLFTFELNIKSELRSIAESNTDSIVYNSIRFEQIEILDDFVNIVELKEANDEQVF